MSITEYGPNFIQNYRSKLSQSAERSHTIDGAIGLLLPASSQLRDYQRHPQNRQKLHNILALNPLQCSLVVVDPNTFNFEENEVVDDGSVFQAIATDETVEFPWLLLQPLETCGGQKFQFRKWYGACAFFFNEFTRQNQNEPVLNPLDTWVPKRKFSPDSMELCRILCERFMSPNKRDIIKSVLQKTLKDKIAKSVAGTVALGVIACSVAAAVCTGVGALTIATTVAESVLKGLGTKTGDLAVSALAGGAAGAAAATALGGAGGRRKEQMPRIVGEQVMSQMELLKARVDRLEHATFELNDKTAVQKAGDAVAQSIQNLRKTTLGRR